MDKFKQLWRDLRSGFWFVPSLIVVVNIGLAVALIEADSAGIDRWLAKWPRLFGAGAEGARGMMSTIAGSMMTVVGVTFSMILVVWRWLQANTRHGSCGTSCGAASRRSCSGSSSAFSHIARSCCAPFAGSTRAHLFPASRCSLASCWRSEVLAHSCSSSITSPLQSRRPASSPRLLRKPSWPLTSCFRKHLDKGWAKTMMTKRYAMGFLPCRVELLDVDLPIPDHVQQAQQCRECRLPIREDHRSRYAKSDLGWTASSGHRGFVFDPSHAPNPPGPTITEACSPISIPM